MELASAAMLTVSPAQSSAVQLVIRHFSQVVPIVLLVELIASLVLLPPSAPNATQDSSLIAMELVSLSALKHKVLLRPHLELHSRAQLDAQLARFQPATLFPAPQPTPATASSEEF